VNEGFRHAKRLSILKTRKFNFFIFFLGTTKTKLMAANKPGRDSPRKRKKELAEAVNLRLFDLHTRRRKTRSTLQHGFFKILDLLTAIEDADRYIFQN